MRKLLLFRDPIWIRIKDLQIRNLLAYLTCKSQRNFGVALSSDFTSLIKGEITISSDNHLTIAIVI